MNDKITVSELINRLKELPQDHIISESVIKEVHEQLNADILMDKKLKITLDVTVPVSDLVPSREEFVDFISDYSDMKDAILSWADDEISEILWSNYKIELV